jgi:hypothetical protein
MSSESLFLNALRVRHFVAFHVSNYVMAVDTSKYILMVQRVSTLLIGRHQAKNIKCIFCLNLGLSLTKPGFPCFIKSGG